MNRRFALIQALVSLVALAAVVWWASRQESPHIPTGGDALAWIVAAVALYVVATLIRAERWHLILHHTGVNAKRSDCYALTTVGYMGNNVLPARAGEALRVVLLSPRCNAGKRTIISSIVAERVLDVIVLLTIFVATVYGVLNTAEVLPTQRPLLVTAVGILLVLAGAVTIWILRKHHFFERVRDWLRPLADSPRALVTPWGLALLVGTFLLVVAGAVTIWILRKHHFFERVRDWLRPLADSPRALVTPWGLALLAGTFLLWTIEASVYWTVARAVDMDISIGGALYLVALTNFVAALPAAPGSIGTFDAAVAWGTHRLGAAGSVAVSYVILIRFVLYVPITIVGLVVLVTRYGGWSRLRSATQLEASSA